jgi:tRNA nucleotidyltransferase (CCA-adding enzyme)
MVTARNLFSEASFALEPETLIERAFALMQQKGITSTVVLNDDDTVAGILAESDIIKMFVNPDSGGVEASAVRDFMTQGAITEQADSDIGKLSRTLLSHHFGQVPIVFNGTFVGVVSRKDIIRHLLGANSE